MNDARIPRGVALLRNPALNKGTAFTDAERDELGLRGLLPARVHTQDEQVERVLKNYAREQTDIERYLFLTALQDRNERLFYRVVTEHIDEMMPIIYTPTVGEACRKFAHLFRRARGLYVTADDRGRIADVLHNWPTARVGVIVVTDGERILGLGDLGVGGMGIPIGKLSLYTACAGISPSQCLPIMLDVGTGNQALLDDPLYFGLRQPRLRGDEYDSLLEEFITAAKDVFPDALIQFEDFLTPNAIAILDRYRDRALCFNDDIQGTAAVALAGLEAAARVTGKTIDQQTVMFLGAGSAATGIADLTVLAMVEAGLSEADAVRRILLCDSKGLIVAGRHDRDTLAAHKRRYAHQDMQPASFEQALRAHRPTSLIGATGRGGAFTREVVAIMAEHNERPVVFALSNPTSRAECTADQAYEWTSGRVVFASGSPFPPVVYEGRTYRTGQGNNAYIFPGIGLGVLACRATRITDPMFLAATRALARCVDPADLEAGRIYPPLSEIRDVSVAIAVAVAEVAYDAGLARADRPDDLAHYIRGRLYPLAYPDLV